MAYKIITDVAIEPVLLAEARLQIRLTADDSTVEDSLIEVWITTAREMAEHYTGRALAPVALESALDEFPCYGGDIALDLPPVTSITSIKYTDTAGVEQTLAADKYALSVYGDARRVSLTYGNVWPSTRAVADAVRIRYATGYTTAPKAVKAAILLTVAHLYEHRGDEAAAQLPSTAQALLDTVKVWGF